MAEAAPDEPREKIVEHLFRALTDINAEGHAIRRPQTLAELQAVTGAEPATLEEIIEAISRRWRFVSQPLRRCSPRARPADRHQPRGPDPLLAADRRPRGRLAPARVPGRPDLEDVAGDGGKGETLSAAATADRGKWLKTLPSEAWAERYGGDWSQVKGLIERSEELAKQREEERQREAKERIKRAEEIAAKEEQLREEQRRRAEDAIASQKRQRWWTIAALGTAVIAIVAAVYAWTESRRADLAAETARAEAKRANEAAIETKAASYWNGLQLWNDPLRPEDVKTLWNVAQEDDTVRVAFVRQLAN